MQKSPFKKLLAGFLASLMLVGALAAVPVFAAGDDGGSGSEAGGSASGSGSDTATDIEFHDNLAGGDAGNPYKEYLERHPAEKAESSIVINAVDYDSANTTAAVEVLKDYEGESEALYMPSTGITSWKINVPADAYYAIRITYFPVTEHNGEEVTTYTTIERTLFIDGRIPFSEASYFYFPRTWEYEDCELDENGNYIFPVDASGNDVRPIRYEKPTWQTYYLRDWLGYTMEPFQFYLSEGSHTVSFEATREPRKCPKATQTYSLSRRIYDENAR